MLVCSDIEFWNNDSFRYSVIHGRWRGASIEGNTTYTTRTYAHAQSGIRPRDPSIWGVQYGTAAVVSIVTHLEPQYLRLIRPQPSNVIQKKKNWSTSFWYSLFHKWVYTTKPTSVICIFCALSSCFPQFSWCLPLRFEFRLSSFLWWSNFAEFQQCFMYLEKKMFSFVWWMYIERVFYIWRASRASA